MIEVLLHSQIFDDIKLCLKKKWYVGLDEEMPRVCRLLMQDRTLPGESPYHHTKNPLLYNKIFHAGVNLPKQNVCKRLGARIVYVRENSDSIKVMYLGGHKDKRYDDSNYQVALINQRYPLENYIKYTEAIKFS